MLRLGYKASAEQFGPAQLLEFAVLAEQRGFDSVFISDHFQPWCHHGGHAPFSLACLSPGRVILGAGSGEALNELPATGMLWPEPRERTARFKEALRLIRTLWSEERVSFDGRYYRTHKATLYDRPELMPPLYVAAGGPVLAKYAGEVADGFICTSGKPPQFYSETLLPNVAAGLHSASRARESIDLMIEMKVSFDTDRVRALQDTRCWAALALTPEQKSGVADPIELERLAGTLTADESARRWLVCSDPDEHVEQMRPYIELGFRHLVFHAPGPDQARFINLYAEQVLPRLRRAYG